MINYTSQFGHPKGNGLIPRNIYSSKTDTGKWKIWKDWSMKLNQKSKNSQQTEVQNLMASQVISTKYFKKSWYRSFSNYPQKIKEEGKLPNSFYKTIITMIQKNRQRHSLKRKLHANVSDEHRCKIINKILSNKMNNTLRIINQNQGGFVTGMQGWFNIHKSIYMIYYVNKMKNKNLISIDADKTLDKIQHHLIKTL